MNDDVPPGTPLAKQVDFVPVQVRQNGWIFAYNGDDGLWHCIEGQYDGPGYTEVAAIIADWGLVDAKYAKDGES